MKEQPVLFPLIIKASKLRWHSEREKKEDMISINVKGENLGKGNEGIHMCKHLDQWNSKEKTIPKRKRHALGDLVTQDRSPRKVCLPYMDRKSKRQENELLRPSMVTVWTEHSPNYFANPL